MINIPLSRFSFAFCLAVLIFFIFPNKNVYCKAESVVLEITELNGRNATILLSNGELAEVNQATLKPGDTHCLKWATKWGAK